MLQLQCSWINAHRLLIVAAVGRELQTRPAGNHRSESTACRKRVSQGRIALDRLPSHVGFYWRIDLGWVGWVGCEAGRCLYWRSKRDQLTKVEDAS